VLRYELKRMLFFSITLDNIIIINITTNLKLFPKYDGIFAVVYIVQSSGSRAQRVL
jgi:hypothetical protein